MFRPPMRAVVISRPGGPEVLEAREVPTPNPSRGEVRVRIHAAGVNRADLLQRAGAYPAPPDAPADIPGLEFSGTIDAIGEAVDAWAIGDRVFGLAGGGAYAEFLVAPSRALAKMPDRLSFQEGAAVPEAFITAYDAMVTQAGLAAGETVLVHAVASGVGTAAVQIARAIGARSIGTSRTEEKLARVSPLGLGEGIVAVRGEFADRVLQATGGLGADVVLELVGGDYLAADLACTAPRGRIVLVGLLGGASTKLDLGLLMRKRITLIGTMLRSRPLEEKIGAMQAFARHVVPLLASGSIAPVVERVLPLDRAGEAHAYMAASQGFGKIVLAVA
jgi:NADPH2:quinone reductase